MSVDDFSYAEGALSKGFIQIQIHWWEMWTGRISSSFFATISSLWASYHSGRFGPATIIPAICLFLAYFVLLKPFSKNLWHTAYLSLVVLVFLFIFTPHIDESWFWMSALMVYTVALVPVLLIITLLYIDKHNLLISTLLILLSFIVSMFNETLSLLLLFLTFSLFGISFCFLNLKIKRKKLLLIFGSLLLGFLIMALAPGNKIRQAQIGINPLSIIETLRQDLKLGTLLFFSFLKRRFIFILIAILFLMNFLKPSKICVTSTKNILLKFLAIWLSFYIITLVYTLPAARVLHGLPPERSHITLSFFLIFSILLSAHLLKQKISKKEPEELKFFIFLIFLICLVSEASRYKERIIQTPIYSQKYATSFQTLLQATKDKKSITIKELPPSGMVYKAYDFYSCPKNSFCIYDKNYFQQLLKNLNP